MMYREILEIDTESNNYKDITDEVNKIIEHCKLKEGLCTVFLQHTTAGLMINENDTLLHRDFRKFFEMVNENGMYAHPGNAFSHIRATILNTEINIPVASGKLLLGQWQRILLCEFDVKPRRRKLIVTIVG